jgi:chromosome segregation ATPase
MQKDRLAVNRALANKPVDRGRELLKLPVAPSFSFDDANCVLDIEIQADQLLLYIDKITSLADRACNTAIRQTETAQLLERSRSAELGNLRNQLDQQRGQYQEQQLALLRVEHESRAQIATLENRLHEIERHQGNNGVQAELRRLQAENAALAEQLAAAEADANASDHKPAAINQEMTELRRQLAQAEETVESKNRAIKETEREYLSKINELETRLSTVESELQTQEAKLKEKEAVLKLSAVKEAEVGNLIKRLSDECATLSGQLQEKNQKLAEIEATKSKPISDAKIWRRMIARLQEETQ